jgi:hypothetical protein
MYTLGDCRPVKMNDLVRLGRNADGGYVISQRHLSNTEILLSFGINDDWSFERDFLKHKAAKLYAYDYSIRSQPFVSKTKLHEALRDYCAGIIGNVFVLRRSKIKECFRKIRAVKALYADFHDLFDRRRSRFFIPKFIGTRNDSEYAAFDALFSDLKRGGTGEPDVFIKMDVEGAEFDVLGDLKPFYAAINGLALEFHNLNVIGNDTAFDAIVRDLKTAFSVAHIHANNHGPVNRETNLPDTLEITFINNALVPGPAVFSDTAYPIAGLDYPNNPDRADYPLVFPPLSPKSF